ncbi:hypothetical protein NC651_021275 [Populus alba x Populus x berolinensis]|nr:hypothetical protein NC651_021275 [Populus alba x Populus x berolinensis]
MKLEEYKATYLSFNFDLQLCLYMFSPTYQQRTRRIGVDGYDKVKRSPKCKTLKGFLAIK